MKKVKSILLTVIIVICFAAIVGCNSISAYDIAVQNGFEGTEEQWLMSLQGKNGTDGKDLTIKDIYNEALQNGFEGNYLDFLHEFMDYDEAIDNSEAITKGLRSAVIVYCEFTRNSSSFLTRSYAQAGAGVIYKINKTSGSAYIITNYHVVYSSESVTQSKISGLISIIPYDGNKLDATFVGGSAEYDIAVLEVENTYFSSDFPVAVTVADSNEVTVGQTAIAIGNPAGQGLSATEGIISVDSEYIAMSDIENPSASVTMRVMRIDAAVNSGNSGGGLFDSQGNLIGIVNAKSSDNTIENMAYAIPSAVATAVAENILKNIVFKKGIVGITLEIKSSTCYLDENGRARISETIAVRSVEGAASGILQTGDIITSVKLDKEIRVTRQFHVIDALLSSSPGDAVVFKVLRNGKEVEATVICA